VTTGTLGVEVPVGAPPAAGSAGITRTITRRFTTRLIKTLRGATTADAPS